MTIYSSYTSLFKYDYVHNICFILKLPLNVQWQEDLRVFLERLPMP